MAANTSLPDPAGVKVVRVETTAQLRHEVVSAAAAADAVVMAAARPTSGPWRPATTRSKGGRRLRPAIELTQNPDILRELSSERLRAGQMVVGFAAETGDETRSVLDLARARRSPAGAVTCSSSTT